jgi:trans-aconitate 2-methyltransferase
MWNPDQYLKFDTERTQPCRDLVSRIMLRDVHRAIDLGCGPGNSTQVLRDRWPNSDITGLDNSNEMLAAAREAQPQGRWIHGDIGQWAGEAGERFDLVFSNAAVHWVPDHQSVFPRLLARTGAALAVQMPGNLNGPVHRILREISSTTEWRSLLGSVKNWQAHEPEFYYDVLSPLASHVDIWTTEYIHVMKSAEAIIEWYKGTGLRPYLDALKSQTDREKFLAEVLERVRAVYPVRGNGHVLFPFRRVFVIAYAT